MWAKIMGSGVNKCHWLASWVNGWPTAKSFIGHFITREEIQLSLLPLPPSMPLFPLFWPVFLWPEQATNEIKVNKQELASAAGNCLCHSVGPRLSLVYGLWANWFWSQLLRCCVCPFLPKHPLCVRFGYLFWCE